MDVKYGMKFHSKFLKVFVQGFLLADDYVYYSTKLKTDRLIYIINKHECCKYLILRKIVYNLFSTA